MEASSIVLIVTSVLTAIILGVLISVTFSMLMVSRKINSRLDDLDDNLAELVSVMSELSTSSQTELEQLHKTLETQQRVHQSIRATSRLVDIVFRKPAVNSMAAIQTVEKNKARKRRRKEKKVDA